MACTGVPSATSPFPDLKGQAPLRHSVFRGIDGKALALFLTSKVRLHCDVNFEVR